MSLRPCCMRAPPPCPPPPPPQVCASCTDWDFRACTGTYPLVRQQSVVVVAVFVCLRLNVFLRLRLCLCLSLVIRVGDALDLEFFVRLRLVVRLALSFARTCAFSSASATPLSSLSSPRLLLTTFCCFPNFSSSASTCFSQTHVLQIPGLDVVAKHDRGFAVYIAATMVRLSSSTTPRAAPPFSTNATTGALRPACAP